VAEATRFGQRIEQTTAASFRCAACGEMAGVVKVTRAGTTVDMGSPLGRQTYDHDAVVVDYFIGPAARSVSADTLDAVQDVVTSQTPDPVALRRIDWELAPFYCPDCDLNYCRTDWHTIPIFDEGFYDYTMGICPRATAIPSMTDAFGNCATAPRPDGPVMLGSADLDRCTQNSYDLREDLGRFQCLRTDLAPICPHMPGACRCCIVIT
jgi:hypothetical protein